MIIDHQGHPYQKTWNQMGYDSAYVPPTCNMTKMTENCIRDPKRIQRCIVVWDGSLGETKNKSKPSTLADFSLNKSFGVTNFDKINALESNFERKCPSS